MNSDITISCYYRLLADICEISEVSLDAPDDIAYDWLVHTGPMLEKQVLRYIEGERVENPEFPEWLMPLWERFLTSKEDKVLRCIRQLLLFCYKIEYEPTHEQIESAQKAFEEVDEAIATWDEAFTGQISDSWLFRRARQIVGSIIYRINWSEIVPMHGPGAVFPPRPPQHKSCFRTLYNNIVERYPFDQYFHGLPSFWEESLVEFDYTLTNCDVIQAKLTAVPKDSRGPRLICVHPAEAIWIQQGQRALLENAITRHPLTRGHVNFTDQTVNGNLALSSSKSGYLCTLDLKEASDRISCLLARHLLGDYAYGWLSCSRASTIKLIDGRVHVLRKWAPMGNALCFPVQSLLFYSLVSAGIYCHYGVNCPDIYVFGDDILFPSKYYDGAIRGLVMAGLVPNQNKTFRKGLFRESCGVDAYNGKDVTPLRLKRDSYSCIQDACSQANLAMRLRMRGYEHCATFMYSMLKQSWRLPKSNNPDSQGLFEYVDCSAGQLLRLEPSCRYRRGVQKLAVRIAMVKSGCKTVSMGDWYHLQDSLLRLTRMGEVQSDRGTEYPDPYLVRSTYGWSEVKP